MESQKHKIVLICMDLQRELSMLELLKKEFEDILQADVWIIGSLADIQKIYYSLNQIKPDMVFISQIIEKDCRNIANYVRKSGATLCVLPVELTYPTKDGFSFLNTKQLYDKYVDYYFLPGRRMYEDISRSSDISKNKMFITGNPKIDLYINKNAKKVLLRREFCIRYSVRKNQGNIFIFTSFVITPADYIKREKAYKGSVNRILKKNKEVLETRDAFVRDIKKLCVDFPKYNIILKPHPFEDSSFYKKIEIKNFYMINTVTFNDTINSIDLAIHWCSTVATECWVNGIKTLQYVPIVIHEGLLTDYNRENPVYNNYLDLRKGISKYLIHNLDKKYLFFQKKYLRFWYYKTDGNSVKRIAIKIKKVLRNEHRDALNYISVNSKILYIFIIAEKILGIRLSRRVVSYFRKDYNWRYAADNFVFRGPGSSLKMSK
jgi:surface carbohydrate biosynthesis protein